MNGLKGVSDWHLDRAARPVSLAIETPRQVLGGLLRSIAEDWLAEIGPLSTGWLAARTWMQPARGLD